MIIALIGHFWPGKMKTGRRVTSISLILLYLLATPLVGDALLSRLEVFPPLPASGPILQDAQAIVVLSAEARQELEYPSLSPGPMTLERLRYGAWLQRRTGLPILVAGGTMLGQPDSLASTMRQSLTEDFRSSSIVWLEDQSQDTHQNAIRSAEVLRAQGITRIFLVTHAWHMPRAKLSFEHAGLTVIPAPTASHNEDARKNPSIESRISKLLPSAQALRDSYFAFHEMGGLAFYWLEFHS
ncbi:YdcF family protein [Telmatospirillum sp.]|uniref:YdcF family protein n=1 Tax=Telmatospirillum sp. TaxID=2079197 RepID=UPI00284B078B|nr:YdcF family protein [Telmatospirillum sp.]MDR3439945.1 YdcF family protein [Telmatospirillum sp.]